MGKEIIKKGVDGLPNAAEAFMKQLQGRSVIAFRAPMGTGKTTFIAALCRFLGVREDAVSSPSFSIVNEYLTASGDKVYHFDFYRISKLEEALDIGFYDYLDSGNLCLIEWPENIEPLLPEETLFVDMEVLPDGSRRLSF